MHSGDRRKWAFGWQCRESRTSSPASGSECSLQGNRGDALSQRDPETKRERMEKKRKREIIS